MQIEWYDSKASREPKTVDCSNSPTAVFLRRNIQKTIIDTNPGSQEMWVYEEAKITHEEYEQMLTEEIARLTPYTLTKTAYIDDTEVVFESVPQGNLSVFVVDSENNYPAYTLERTADRLKVSFEPCKTITTVTISII